jgi:hypothetical protein
MNLAKKARKNTIINGIRPLLIRKIKIKSENKAI